MSPLNLRLGFFEKCKVVEYCPDIFPSVMTLRIAKGQSGKVNMLHSLNCKK
jgi:hypothetical protein